MTPQPLAESPPRSDGSRPPAAADRRFAGIPLAWVPNLITALRLVLIPVFVGFANRCQEAVDAGEGGGSARLGAVAVLFAIGLSDVADGFLARRLGLATPRGAMWDATADKLTQVALLLYFCVDRSPAFAPIHPGLLILVIARDVLLGIGWLTVKTRRPDAAVEHRGHGRLSSAVVFALFGLVTLGLSGPWLGPSVVAIAVVVVLSTAAYMRKGWQLAS